MSSSSSEEGGAAHEDAAAGSKPPKILVILLGANLALTGLVAFKTLTAKPAVAHAETAGADDPVKREVTGPVVALDPFVVNLNEPGSARYLKVTMQAELANGSAVKVFDKSKQLIRDAILRYLSGLKVADTLGPDNKDHIREDLETAVSDIIGEDRLHRMIFAEFVVQ
ncbi:MAG TPA: flagellar basal body-associated FliL family protein [Kofleriaceae bacterium]|nr:flagellar basal body-associated FliL family protein [Kofleriaceae bacterium]